MKRVFWGYRRMALILIDLLFFVFAVAMMFFYLDKYVAGLSIDPLGYVSVYGVLAACIFVCRLLFGVYSCVWRYVVILDYIRVFASDVVGSMVFWVIKQTAFTAFPLLKRTASQSVRLSDFVCTVAVSLIAVLISRFFYQYLFMRLEARQSGTAMAGRIPIGIVGAGKTGALLAESLLSSEKARYYPYCFFDVDLNKVGKTVKGVMVRPANEYVVETIKKLPIKELVITVSSGSVEEKKALFELYETTGLPIKIYDHPLDSEASGEEGSQRRIRDFRIEDLLFRDAIDIQSDTISHFFRGKTVLVTGGGGSIGSELCRQIALLEPEKLIILDIYENNAYDIQQELVRRYPNRGEGWLEVEIASVRDTEKINRIMRHYRPNMVFHAAAHKHVPLMEHNCDEAVKNNVFGTYNVVTAAEDAGVDRFVMISTDKAVNPTNVMGASKRLCEMIVQSRRKGHTQFAAVRFGNVLGSNGSVIPLFKRQIEAGGPVTITDKRIIRYFMTIPEAAQLVMQAGVIASNNEIFVLDMGNPVKILELAENMIRLSGFKPYEDIDIVEIGLRPGEKLYEELLIKTEKLTKTANNKIFIERDNPPAYEDVERALARLADALEDQGGSDSVRALLKELVPTFCDPDEVNSEAESAEEMRRAEGI